MDQLHYLEVLDLAHRMLFPRNYLEIGVSKGHSAALLLDNTSAVGVDPSPRVVAQMPDKFVLERQTSDEYFAKIRSRQPRPLFDLMFIDGMHLLEFVLRDFINCEHHAHSGSIIFVHDCLPPDEVAARRCPQSELWTGDVWKLLAYLLLERTDLEITVFDAPPSGLLMVQGLGRTDETRAWSAIAPRYLGLDYDYYLNEVEPLIDVIRSQSEEVSARLPSSPYQTNEAVEVAIARRDARTRRGLSSWSQARSIVSSRRGRLLLIDKLRSKFV